ncbi:3-Deoxy-D-manno-octulosonic-acid transferase family protein [Hydrogenophaga sp. RAC07]|uniref:3-deoxy-D-manno-octulosonic acid transferase n=1 Tax=Hydrogenophaga sp. RAC07 TaxID=1842537 RepID=UPI00083E60D9|nr:glycosyltransferase N-terminal domain-containing protein [Hydrogenophaga sp. RAC07]AOF87738.1 3-Deoxy-D-manno-octulosonic-acid transferase family protein [Hydrogenophaga sp. RAC07]
MASPTSTRAASRPFPPSWRLSVLIGVYELLWHLLLPVFLLFLWKRGKREPLYREHWGERFGAAPTGLNRPVWVHSASMGEMRGAAPLVRALLAAGYPVFITTLTPAGRTAAHSLFAEAMDAQRLQVSYVPLELGWAVRRLIHRVRPRAAVMTEIDTWPVLLATIRRQGVPLAMANAQYPKKSIVRDRKWGGFRAGIFQAYELVLCKSETHAQRFRDVGCERVVIAGETRFDLPVSPQQIGAAQALLAPWQLATASAGQRPVLCFASAIVGEDEQFIDAIRQVQAGLQAAGLPPPLVVYVPRSPQRFDAVVQMFEAAGLRVARRSRMLDATLQPTPDAPDMSAIDVLMGDSLGEMYFYLALSQVVVVGASFVPLGAHNVIEPLALRKPVMVGHSIWGIEYPGVEALAAGVLQQHMTIDSLSAALVQLLTSPADYARAIAGAEAFYAEHGGATAKHMATLVPWLEAR